MTPEPDYNTLCFIGLSVWTLIIYALGYLSAVIRCNIALEETEKYNQRAAKVLETVEPI